MNQQEYEQYRQRLPPFNDGIVIKRVTEIDNDMIEPNKIQLLFGLLCASYALILTYIIAKYAYFNAMKLQYERGEISQYPDLDLGINLVKVFDYTNNLIGNIGVLVLIPCLLWLAWLAYDEKNRFAKRLSNSLINIFILILIASIFSLLYGFDDINLKGIQTITVPDHLPNQLGIITAGWLIKNIGVMATKIVCFFVLSWIIKIKAEEYTDWRLRRTIMRFKTEIKKKGSEKGTELKHAMLTHTAHWQQEVKKKLGTNKVGKQTQQPVPSATSAVKKKFQNPVPVPVPVQETANEQVQKTAQAVQQKLSSYSVLLGTDMLGNRKRADLRFPHLLIAGSSGMGKSNFLHVLITQLISKNSPKELSLMMFDMKGGVELGDYENIPHLLHPVAETIDQCIGLLKELVNERERRQKLIRKAGYKKLTDWQNADPKNALPTLFVFFDEIVVLVQKDKEYVIPILTDLLSLGRSAGLHCVLATQYPKAEVLPSNITVNCNARVAFALQTKIQSQVVLDKPGAERLENVGQCKFVYGKHDLVLQTDECDTAYITNTVNRVIEQYGTFKPKEMLNVTPKEMPKPKEKKFRLGEVPDWLDEDIESGNVILAQIDEDDANEDIIDNTDNKVVNLKKGSNVSHI